MSRPERRRESQDNEEDVPVQATLESKVNQQDLGAHEQRTGTIENIDTVSGSHNPTIVGPSAVHFPMEGPEQRTGTIGNFVTVSGSSQPIIIGSSTVNITFNNGPDSLHRIRTTANISADRHVPVIYGGSTVNIMNYSLIEGPRMPAEIRNQEVFEKALAKGSATVHRTRLMIVGQERVGKTSLMKRLTHQSFNQNEESTKGITTDCTINICSAQSWEYKKGYLTSLADHELMIGLNREKDKHDDMEPLQSTPTHELQAASAASQTQTAVKLTSDVKQQSATSKYITKAMSKEETTRQITEQLTLNIWDFAGQDMYYTTHQTFLSSRSIYLVVFNLCHDLDKPVPVPEGARCKDGSGSSSTYRTNPIQYLDFWMQSIFTYTKENASQERLEQKSPPIFIVGTHRNDVGGADLPENERKVLIDEIFQRIRGEIYNKPYYRYVVSEFYAIENSLEDNKKTQKLCNHIESIAMTEPYMGEKIPLKWLTFDNEKEVISGGKPVMALKQVMDGFEIEDKAELLTMLKFYHDLGHIIYFGGDSDNKSQALKDVVILKPQWLIDAFKKILTVKHPRKQSKQFADSWDQLEKMGILKDSLIDHMWQDILEHKKALLDLMDMFDLLCERVDEPLEEEHSGPDSATAPKGAKLGPANASYYVPSMLQQRTSSSLPLETSGKQNANVFYVDFKGFLPDGLFHRLIVRSLRWSQKLGGTDPSLQYDQGRFYVDVQHEFTLQIARLNNLAFIKVSVKRAPVGCKSPEKQQKMTVKKTPSPVVTKKVLDFVEDNLQNLKDMWMKRINYTVSVECPCERSSLHFLPLDKCLEKLEVPCRIDKSSQQVILTHPFQAMFNQESSEEEATAPEDRPPLPMSERHFRDLAKDIGGEWKELATFLGFETQDLYKLEYEHRRVNDQIYEMLVLWKQKHGGTVNEMQKELSSALIKVDKPKLADEVLNY